MAGSPRPKIADRPNVPRLGKTQASPKSSPKIKKLSGRPQILTPKLQEKIIKFILGGAYVETAAVAVGISKKTFYRWLKAGREETSGIYYNFCHEIEKAFATKEANNALAITAHGEKNWQALAWQLERMAPQRWGRTDRMQLEHSGTTSQLPPQIIIKLPSNGKRADENEPNQLPSVMDAYPEDAD
jgi:hypothetical protein